MTYREIVGLGMLIVAIAIAPLGYLISTGWIMVSLALGLPGAVLFFTARMAKRLAESEPDDTPYGGHAFHGGHIFQDDADGD